MELSHWHPDALAKVGESYEDNHTSIGLDRVRGISRITTEMDKRYKGTLQKLGGLHELPKQLVQMYLDRHFSENGKGQ